MSALGWWLIRRNWRRIEKAQRELEERATREDAAISAELTAAIEAIEAASYRVWLAKQGE